MELSLTHRREERIDLGIHRETAARQWEELTGWKKGREGMRWDDHGGP